MHGLLFWSIPVFKIILPQYSLTVFPCFAVFSARIAADIADGDAASESLV